MLAELINVLKAKELRNITSRSLFALLLRFRGTSIKGATYIASSQDTNLTPGSTQANLRPDAHPSGR
jgi:hypothetical protein